MYYRLGFSVCWVVDETEKGQHHGPQITTGIGGEYTYTVSDISSR